MIIPPVVNKKPNIVVGSVYKIKLNGKATYTFHHKNDYHTVLQNDTMTLVDIRPLKNSFEFTFIIDNKLVTYKASNECLITGYTCNFEEIV